MVDHAATPRRPEASALWRSPDERQGVSAWQRGEFPAGADLAPDAMTRRSFLSLAAASLALAGLSGCIATPASHLVPAVHQPPELVPGVPRWYASALIREGYATGILVETHEGRPTKIEGNPDHPSSLGRSGVLEQAAILDLYDPARGRDIRQGLQPMSWLEARRALRQAAGADGQGLHLLLEPSSSPSLAEQLAELRASLPRAVVHWHATAGHEAALAASQRLLGRGVLAHPDGAGARVGLILGADPFVGEIGSLRQAHGWAQGRGETATPNRWYAIEATPTCSGLSADHRLIVDERWLPLVAAQLLAQLLLPRPDLPSALRAALQALPDGPLPRARLAVISDDLRRAGTQALVVCGRRAPPELQGLAIALNAALDAHSVGYRPSQLIGGDRDGLRGLIAALDQGAVQTLVIIGGNPLFTASADLEVGTALAKAGQRVRVGLYDDETSQACDWYIPQAHALESWADARAYDGTLALQQPVIEPLYAGRSQAEILCALLGQDEQPAHAWLRERWRRRGVADGDFDQVIRTGGVATSAAPLVAVTCDQAAVAALVAEVGAAASRLAPGTIDLALIWDGKVEDGLRGDNPWLQELPDAVGKLTWDNALLIAPALARRLGVESGQLIEVRQGARALAVPALIQPGQASGTVALALGYGRRASRGAAQGVGVDGYQLRRWDQPWLVHAVALRVLPARRELAITQEHWAMEDRPVALDGDRHQPLPPAIAEQAGAQPSLRPPAAAASSPQWGMVVDLGSCTGCSACVTACQAENNIPVVGREEVLRSREMHWMRVDRYYRGSVEAPTAINQPMLCQHCEQAPCEYVCPTYATTHSPDGLNEMTYNRCVGTRFCSNNCPYKVRRFNWFNYHQQGASVVRLAMNPDVTVRARGVMEKCTYCVQRIRETDIRARVQGLEPGALPVVTACQQACPTQAIVFGNILAADAAVAQARRSPRAYAVLADSGAQPRTRYLARLTNPNPEWA